MAKKFVFSLPGAVSAEKAEAARQQFAEKLGVSATDVLVLSNGVSVTVVEVPDPPPPAKALKVTPPPKE